jgi:hypothetical protein
MDVLYFYLQKLKRDLEEAVMREQLIRRLVDFNFGPPGRMANGRWLMADGEKASRQAAGATSYPRFALGSLDRRNLEQVGTLISDLVQGKVISPDEAWIREYLGIPAA